MAADETDDLDMLAEGCEGCWSRSGRTMPCSEGHTHVLCNVCGFGRYYNGPGTAWKCPDVEDPLPDESDEPDPDPEPEPQAPDPTEKPPL